MTDPVWHADWSGSRVHWPEMFADLGLIGKPNLCFIEIGVFEGGSAHWTLANVLTGPGSRLYLIDPLEFTEIHGENQYERILRHLGPWFHNGQANFYNGASEDVLRGWTGIHWTTETLDFAYIDGDHFPAGVIKDAVLVWPLLKPGGHMLFDDYVYELGGHAGPRAAIDAFVEWFAAEIASHAQVGPDQYLIEKT